MSTGTPNRVVLLSLLAAVGCTTRSGAVVPCSTSADCDLGQQCIDDLCQDPGGSSSVTATATATVTAGDDGTTGYTTGDDGTSSDDDATAADTGMPPSGAGVDILLVVDNSGSMGEEQGTLATNIGGLTSQLSGLDYRIGITTTDNGNPWCSGTTPEGGALRLTTCTSRLEEFIFTGTDPPTNKQMEACQSVCGYDSIDIGPTTTHVDPTPRAHPWVESIGGTTNVSPFEVEEALACFVPQGINGCGFESHLESMYKGLKRAEDANENGYGFIRPDAVLAVIFVSDEVDCSYNLQFDSIFKPDGDRAFWSDPNAAYPTSAVCWNAGVTCTGGPGTYDGCSSENKDEIGNTTDDADAVLQPLSRYRNLLAAYQDQGKPTLAFGIVGVPQGYDSGQDIVYQDTQDAQFQDDYGIGPGCSSAAGAALPPVRLLDLTQEFWEPGSRGLYSVCASDYGPALRDIGRQIITYAQ